MIIYSRFTSQLLDVDAQLDSGQVVKLGCKMVQWTNPQKERGFKVGDVCMETCQCFYFSMGLGAIFERTTRPQPVLSEFTGCICTNQIKNKHTHTHT